MQIKNKKNNNIFEVISMDDNGVTILNNGKRKDLKMSTVKKNYLIVEQNSKREIAMTTEVEDSFFINAEDNCFTEVEDDFFTESETQQKQDVCSEVEMGVETDTQNELPVGLTEVDKIIIDFIDECEGKLAIRPTKYFVTFYKKVEGGRDKMLAECELQKKAMRFYVNKKHLSDLAIHLSVSGISSIGECSYKFYYNELNDKDLANVLKVVLDDLKQIILN